MVTLTYLLRFFPCLRGNVTLSMMSTLFSGLLHFSFETIMKNVLMKHHVCRWHFCARNVNVETHMKHGSRLQDTRLGGGNDVNGEPRISFVMCAKIGFKFYHGTFLRDSLIKHLWIWLWKMCNTIDRLSSLGHPFVHHNLDFNVYMVNHVIHCNI